MDQTPARTALVLSGGGARGAYQVGVLKAVAELFPKSSHNPFSIICGTSAGAVNGSTLASTANNFRLAVKKLERIWANLHVDQVYKSGSADVIFSVLRLLLSIFHEGTARHRPLALLDSAPMRVLLSHAIHYRNIQKRIDEGYLQALAITAMGYGSGESVTFYQGQPGLQPWERNNRVGRPSIIHAGHLMASTAIPTIFPAEKIGTEFFGDGALRQLSPISPALHLGAERIFIIGVSGNERADDKSNKDSHTPSLANMVGQIFNSAFIDSLESDLDHLVRINDLVGIIENEVSSDIVSNLRKVDSLVIEPSIEFDKLAGQHVKDLPFMMRQIFKGTGATERGGGSSMASYLLFEAEYCKQLINSGYQDAMNQEIDIRSFFSGLSL